MNTEERDLIAQFVGRVGGGPQSGLGGSVPTTTASLPPIDPEADRFIAENFQRYPEARYRITQMAVVQEAALAAAQNRIRQLEWQLQQAQAAAQQAQQRPSGGLFGGLFGGGQQRAQNAAPPPGWGQQPQQNPYMQAPPQAMYPAGVNPSMFPQRGTGFLGSALTTAAGVAGGMMAANALEGLFSGHQESSGWGAGGSSETIINNNYGNSDPFSGGGASVDQGFDAGGDSGGFDDGGFDDNSF